MAYTLVPGVDPATNLFPPEVLASLGKNLSFYRGALSTTSVLKDIPSGVYSVATAAIRDALGFPGTAIGPVLLSKNSTGVGVYLHYFTADGVFHNYHGSGGWVGWSVLTEDYKRTIPDGTDWNTITAHGEHQKVYAHADPNSPSTSPGTLIAFDTTHPNGITSHLFLAYAGNGIFYRSQNASSVWLEWQRLDRTKDAQPDEVSRGQYNRSLFRSRRGGSIGTNGRAAVGLRFDHHLLPFGEKVLPLLKTYRMPWAQAINPANVGGGDDNWSFAKLQTECLNSGGEVYNHGRNHQDATTVGQLRREIVQSLSELREGLPKLSVEGWMPPGVGAPGYMGFSGFATEEEYSTIGGGMVLSRHGAVHGYVPGIYREMDGSNPIGRSHTTLDQATLASVQGIVNGAVKTGSGVILMLHSNYLDQSGYMTTAVLESIISWLSDQRDAGNIEILTPSGILLADVHSSYRRNLLQNGLANTMTASNPYSENVAITRADQRGVPHQAVVHVKSISSGSPRLRIVSTHPGGTVTSEDFAYVSSGNYRTFIANTTVPLDATQVTVSLSTGGTFEHSEIKFHAV